MHRDLYTCVGSQDCFLHKSGNKIRKWLNCDRCQDEISRKSEKELKELVQWG